MTMVKLMGLHKGFEVITSRIKTTRFSTRMWMVSFAAFCLSAILDTLTTTIVMVSLMIKLLGKHDDHLLFTGIIVIAANAGGTWTPMGDVTTMLWLTGQITAAEILKVLLLSSLVTMSMPLTVTSCMLLNSLARAIADNVPLAATSMGMCRLYSTPDRQLLVGIHGPLRRHRYLDYAHRLGCRGGGHGLEKNDSFWPVKRISVLALIGSLAGALFFIMDIRLFEH